MYATVEHFSTFPATKHSCKVKENMMSLDGTFGTVKNFFFKKGRHGAVGRVSDL